MTPSSRSFCIYFFSDPSSFAHKCTSTFERITLTKQRGAEHYTVGQVKKEAGKAAKLLPSSLTIFGLFLGDEIGLPRKYCPDEATVPVSVTEFSFQLVSFDPAVENEVICKDEKAMELVYWELKNKWGNYGFPFFAQVECNKSFFAMYKSITEKVHLTSSNMLNFIQTLRIRSSCFITHYYHVRHVEVKLKNVDNSAETDDSADSKKLTPLTYCFTEDLHVVEKVATTPRDGRRQSRARVHLPPLDSMAGSLTNVTVALNKKNLIILDAVGRSELLSLDWTFIKSLRKSNKHYCFVIEFLISSGQSRYITIKTDCNNFLFSISKHIIRLIKPFNDEKTIDELHMEFYSSFQNPLFTNVPVNDKKLCNVITDKAVDLTMLDEEVEEKLCMQHTDSHDSYTGSSELPVLQTSRSLSLTESIKSAAMNLTDGDTIKSPRKAIKPESRMSILQMPLSMLLPPHEILNFNKNNNKRGETSSSISLCGANKMDSREDSRSSYKPPRRRSLAVSASKVPTNPNEGMDDGTQKESASRRKKNTVDAIPRVPAGKSSFGTTAKTTAGARNPTQTTSKNKAKPSSVKTSLSSTLEEERRPSL